MRVFGSPLLLLVAFRIAGPQQVRGTDSLTLPLKDGDYVRGSVAQQQGRVVVAVRAPDGTVLRQFADADRGKIAFAFAAEGSGRYTIAVANRGAAPASHQIVVDTILSLANRLAPEPWVDSLKSPRIEALRAQVGAGNTNTDGFWKDMATIGTPLVEPIDSDARHVLVTFLWRARHDTRNVVVMGTFDDPVHYEDLAMHRVGASDVWYLTRRMPAGARFMYDLSPNDPITWEGPRPAERAATRQMDPLNRHTIPFSGNPPEVCGSALDRFRCRNIAELPNATPQPWLVRRPGTPAGKLDSARIKTDVQGNSRTVTIERTFSIYTPANYAAAGAPNRLVVLFDGPIWSESAEEGRRPWMLTTLDELIAAKKIPPTVVVMVNNDFNRRIDLVANDAFADFLAKELVPWIRAHYNVTTDPAQTAVGGTSAGGLQAAYVGYRHSGVFGNVISMSGAFWWAPAHNSNLCSAECRALGHAPGPRDATTEPNYMAELFLKSPRLPLRFHLDAGTFETDHYSKGGDILEPTRHLRDVLRAKGYDVQFEQFHGGHDGLAARGTIADALIFLLGGR